MKKLSLVAVLAILSACKSEQGDAIHAKVLLPSVQATCVRFEVRDPSGARATETRWLKRTAGDDDLQIAIFRGTLPETVELAARPYVGGDCDGGAEARTFNGPYETVSAAFVKDDITSVTLELKPGTDGDGDGYVSTGAGGADCADGPGQGGVNPGAQEQCSDQSDLNCDGTKGCAASACPATACIGPPANLVLTLPAGSVEAGTCTSATVQVKDERGSNTTVTAATQVSLTATPAGGVVFFSDAACITPATSVTVAAGAGSATFYFKGQVAGSITVNTTATNLTPDSKIAQIIPGPGNRLVFTSSAQTVTAGACSAPVQFQSQDAQSNAAPVTAATAVTLAASPSTGFKFYSDAGCNTEITSTTIAAGASTGTFRFKGTSSGTVTITLTATGLTGSSQNQTINAGAPASMVFTGPGTLQAGDCSNPVTIDLRDAFNNPAVATANTNITLNTTGVTLSYSTVAGCTPTTTTVSIPQGASTVSFRYRGTAAGTATVSGTATGLTTQTPLSVTINPGPPTTLIFTTGAQTLAAGSCSAVATVRLRDAFNNPVRVSADTAVALSANPSTGFQFFADTACAAGAVTSVNIPASASDASFYFKGTSAGTPTISATVSGVPAATQGVTINPAAPTVLVFSQPSLTMTAGVCTQVTLLVQDAFGNASPVSSNQAVTFAAAPSTGFSFSPNSDCTGPTNSINVNSGQSSRVLYVKGTVSGSVTVTASRAGFTSGTLPATVNAAAPSKLEFQTSAQTVVKDVCSAITTVRLLDAFNNVATATGDTQINLTGSTGTISFYSDATCTTATTFTTVTAGQSSASFYFKDSAVENVTITAASSGLTNATQQQTINPVPPTELAFTTAAQTVPTGTCSGVVIVETRASGVPTTVTTNTSVTLSAAPSPSGITFYSNSNCSTVATQVTISAGAGSALFYYRGTTPGTFTITAAFTGLTSATQNATVTALPTKLIFATSSLTTQAGVCSAVVTVQSADASNNVAPVVGNTTVNLTQTGSPADPQFRFYSDASCGTTTTSVTILAGQSTASFYYKGEKARTVTLQAAATGLTSGTQDHSMVAGNATVLAFSAATPAQTLLAGACSNIRTVEARDAFGNLATNGVSFNLTGSITAEFFQDLNCTTPITNPVAITPGNSSTSFYFKGVTGGINVNGTLTLTGAQAGLTSATQAETIIPTVRTGSCTITGTSVNCTIAPALLDVTKAFVVFQATSTNANSDATNVRCFVNTVSQVRCERAANAGADVNVRWSVAEFPSGVNVQHKDVPCGNDTTNVTLTSVTLAQSFLLLSSLRDVTNMGNTVPRLAELTSATQAQIRKTGGCGTDSNHLQAVDYNGVSVQRGLTNLGNGSASTQVTLPSSVALSRSILLYSYISDGSGAKICDRVLRGELTNGGSKVTFSRGDGDTANCTGSSFTSISWEVIEFPVGTVVQQITQPLAGGAPSVGATIQEVDLSRTLVIGGGQWASGQLHGEGRHSASELISEMRAQAFLPDSTHLNFFRETSNNTATFTAYVVQLKP